MIILKKSIGALLVITTLIMYQFTLHTDKSFKPIKLSLNELENAPKGNYKTNAKIVDINPNDFTINNGEISLQIRGSLSNEKLSNLYRQKRDIFGEIQLSKSGGEYTLISIKRHETELYVEDYNAIKDKVIINSKGILGRFN